MPIGPYKNFAECVAAQMKKGKSKESAQKICGAIEKKTKQKKELELRIARLELVETSILIQLGKLKSKTRKKLPDSSFAIPSKRKYPIHDRSHAANALARVAQHGTPAEKKQVRAAVCKKYPDLPACKKDKEKKERGQGQGQDGPRQGDGGSSECVCTECGATVKHEKGKPCTSMKCPKCGGTMRGK